MAEQDQTASSQPGLSEDEVWAQSLERVRRDPDYGLKTFQERLDAFKKRRDWGALPPMDIALWPGDVLKPNDVDISNPRLFNERYIELPTEDNLNIPVERRYGAHTFNRVALFFHHMVLVLILIAGGAAFYENKLGVPSFFILTGGYVLGGGLPFLFFWILSPFSSFAKELEKKGSARFNHQAQMVHISRGEHKVLHVPWRHVKAMVEFSAVPGGLGGTRLKLVAPRPWALEESNRILYPNGRADDDDLFRLPYGLAVGDGDDIAGALEHWEFLRRYMERGLEAIQPDPELREKGLIRPPGGESPAVETLRKESFSLGDIIFYPIDKLIYWSTFGPWLDRKFEDAYRKLDLEGFEWPEEVEAMCGLNPDLTGVDIRPVVPRTNLFYRYMGLGGYQYVDAQGNPARAAISKEAMQKLKEGKLKIDTPKASGESWTPPK